MKNVSFPHFFEISPLSFPLSHKKKSLRNARRRPTTRHLTHPSTGRFPRDFFRLLRFLDEPFGSESLASAFTLAHLRFFFSNDFFAGAFSLCVGAFFTFFFENPKLFRRRKKSKNSILLCPHKLYTEREASARNQKERERIKEPPLFGIVFHSFILQFVYRSRLIEERKKN